MNDAPKNSIIWKVSSVAVLGSFLAQIDATMLTTAMPVLANELKTGIVTIQWVVTGYLLAMVLALPLAGSLFERLGSRQTCLLCYAAFSSSAILCSFAWSAESLIAFRVIHGLIGGLMAPLSQIMIASVAGDRMGRVAGYAAIPILTGPVLGPALAGIVLTHLSWHWLFVITSVLSGVGFFGVLLLLSHETKEVERPTRNVDWSGLLLLSPGLALIMLSLDRIVSMAGIFMLVGGLLLIALFVRHILIKGSEALIDPVLFRMRFLRAAAIVQFLTYGANMACQFLLPMFLVKELNRPVADVGLLMAPLGIGLLCAYPVMGRAVEHFGARCIALVGNITSLTSISIIITVASGLINPLFLVVSLFLLGCGQGATGIAAVTAGYGTVPKASLANAAMVLNIAQRLGGPVLATLCGTLLGRLLKVQNTASAHIHAFMVAFAMVWITLALCTLVVRELPSKIK